MKTIAINGCNGFLGNAICTYFESKYTILKISRNDYFLKPELLAEKLEGVDIIINIAGKSISSFWTKKNKKSILSSRVDTTKNLVLALGQMKSKPELFISFSAVGIYDAVHIHNESSIYFGNNFLSEVCRSWETVAFGISQYQIDSVILRLGIVLDKRGGFIHKVLPLFKVGCGSILGDGQQTFPFISLIDFLKGIDFVIERHITGIVNFVAPEAGSNFEFAKKLSILLKRPLFIRLPIRLIRLFFGEQNILFLEGQKVYPGVLIQNGFEFQYDNLDKALDSIIKESSIGTY